MHSIFIIFLQAINGLSRSHINNKATHLSETEVSPITRPSVKSINTEDAVLQRKFENMQLSSNEMSFDSNSNHGRDIR